MMSWLDLFKLYRRVDLLNKMLKVKSREMGKQESAAISFAIKSPSLPKSNGDETSFFIPSAHWVRIRSPCMVTNYFNKS